MESASAKSRISEQMLCRQNLCKFVVHLVTSYRVLGFQITRMYVLFLATFDLTDFREKRKQYDMVSYFNQQAPTVSVFRIYHIEIHVMNIC